MKWRCLLAVLLGLSFTDVATFAERPPDAERPSPPPSQPLPAYSFSETGAAKFQLVGGRIRLHPSLHRRARETRQDGGVRESLRVTSRQGIPSLQYSLDSPARMMTIAVIDAESLRLELVNRLTGHRHVLEQMVDEPVRWRIETPENQRSFQAKSLPHLRQRDPYPFDAAFEVIITRLLRGRSLKSFCEQVDDELVRSWQNESLELPSRRSVLEAVDGLASQRQHVRLCSLAKLRSFGTPVLSILDELSDEDLDAEQRRALKQLTHDGRMPVEDTVSTWTAELLMDRNYIAGLGPNLTSGQRIAANAHFRSLGLAEVRFADDVGVRIARH